MTVKDSFSCIYSFQSSDWLFLRI